LHSYNIGCIFVLSEAGGFLNTIKMDISIIIEIALLTVNPAQALTDALEALNRKALEEAAAQPYFDMSTEEGAVAYLNALCDGLEVANDYSAEIKELKFWMEMVTFGGFQKMTRAEAVKACDEEVKKAKQTIKKWEGRQYKATTAGTWVGTEMEGRRYTFSHINSARRDSHLRGASQTIERMEESKDYYLTGRPFSCFS